MQSGYPNQHLLFMDDSDRNTRSAVINGVTAGLVPKLEPGGGLSD